MYSTQKKSWIIGSKILENEKKKVEPSSFKQERPNVISSKLLSALSWYVTHHWIKYYQPSVSAVSIFHIFKKKISRKFQNAKLEFAVQQQLFT